ncbi:RNA polymerase sigma-70 factor (ECF subfamily) [Microbacterium terrae]|uniref:RNA polymerase sigma factor n=1 Tax=Microbacterium terrae TaxID=69369 RepID=A0A0M2H230_9MICO|nr:RNA polymerase sigma factor [Microbacterium terrae]MBP1076455.1 RNA polymerase sigma-70 factor (ECF subfamily) [Microbacterium terrae]GLJ97284.1 RNA polymerase subunit sigma-24 [Microbacterium terrae]
MTGDWTLAEDCAQDAFEKAAGRWPSDGVPSSPGAWLTTVARNAAMDRLRRRATEVRKITEVGVMRERDGESFAPDAAELALRPWEEDADDRLRLIFTCAHPALEMPARVALTLRTVAGLSTPEIARAFLVPEATMAQRIVRAKRRIAHAGIPYRVPAIDELPGRLDGVLSVLYLVFSEGYAASSGDDIVRRDLAAEAIRLTRLVLEIVPGDFAGEARALLALMLLQDSRRDARTDASGDLIPLEEQDRAVWDRSAVEEAVLLLRAPAVVHGAYRVQALLAAEHATAPSAAATDWGRIVELYDELATFTASPMVQLSRAIAIGFRDGTAAGLAALDRLDADGSLAGHHLLPAAQADLLRRSGDETAAAERYRAALDLAPTAPERRFLLRRLRELGASG